jgi:hypothetical protein
MPHGGMARYTLKDLLMGTTIVAVGLGMLVFAATVSARHDIGWLKATQVGLISCGSMTIGAGIAHPFKSGWLGVAVGGVIVWFALHIILFPS